MFKFLVLNLHLFAAATACLAILVADLQLLCRRPLRLAAPSRRVMRLVGSALAVLLASGAALIGLGLAADPYTLHNPKLLAKLLLVALLCANAVVLHRLSFPRLAAHARGARELGLAAAFSVALPGAVSHALWAYCAFLGVAKAWNHRVPFAEVMGLAGLLVLGLWMATLLLLAAARRPQAVSGAAGHLGQPVQRRAHGGAAHRRAVAAQLQ